MNLHKDDPMNEFEEKSTANSSSSSWMCCSCVQPDKMETNMNKPLRRIKFYWTDEIIKKHSNTDKMKKPMYVAGNKRMNGAPGYSSNP